MPVIVCVCLVLIVLLESSYIIQQNQTKKLFLSKMNYYGNCESPSVVVELTAVKDFFQVQSDLINIDNSFKGEISFKSEGNENLLLYGYVYFPLDIDFVDGRITILAKNNTSTSIPLFESPTQDDSYTYRKMCFLLDDIDIFEIDEISKCIIMLGKQELEVDVTATEARDRHPPI